MSRVYREITENLTRMIEKERRDRRREERVHGARKASSYVQAARDQAREVADKELERLCVCGLITEDEYKQRQNQLRLRHT